LGAGVKKSKRRSNSGIKEIIYEFWRRPGECIFEWRWVVGVGVVGGSL